MRIPYALSGMVLLPVLVGLAFLFQIKFLATPIFLPLIMIYKLFGAFPGPNAQEAVFIFLYWALVGCLLGFILDLCSRPSQYLPEQRPPV